MIFGDLQNMLLLNGLDPDCAAKKSQVWSPRNLYPSDPSIAGGSVGADTHRSQRLEFSLSIFSMCFS